MVDQVVHRHGDRLHDRHGDAQAHGRFHPLRHGQVGTHAEEEGQGQVLGEDRSEQQAQVVFEHVSALSPTEV